MNEAAALPHGPPILPPTPAGLESLYTLCRKIYPDQVNPLQVTALLKYWYGTLSIYFCYCVSTINIIIF